MALSFPDIDPVALSLGPIVIRWYALAYLSGILLGWAYAVRLAKRDPHRLPDARQMDDFVPFAVLGVVGGGRLGYVLFYNLEYFLANPLHIFFLWEGGMSFHGGALGVITAIIGYCLYHRIPLLQFADIVTAVVPIGLFFGRLANFINAELYGRVTDVPWAIIFPGSDGQPRHPSQLYEAFLEGIVLFLILTFLYRRAEVRSRPGIVAGVFLSGYGIFRFLVEYVREPDMHLGYFFNLLTMGQILCLPMIVVGIGLIIYAARVAKARQTV